VRRLALLISALAAIFIVATAANDARGVNDAAITADGYPAHLSDYAFFTDLKARTPATRVMAYHLNTPLFSDYAEKYRYLYIPAGQTATYEPDAVIDLPIGAALIKFFGYEKNGAYKPLETRVLLHRASGWVALPYVWNVDGSDADLKRAGTRIPVTFTDPSGQQQSISYAVPNQNQCRECHGRDDIVTPIGPKIRNLNDGHQLQAMLAAQMLDRLPADAPRSVAWDDTSAPLEDRARAYLESNCAHCHNPHGAASNSGLFLDWKETDPVTRGLLKRPVAAGRGSGGRDFDIDPGKPDDSIILYRMASTEPGDAMPEIGRSVPHAEALALIRQWIAGMPPAGADAH
jgi:uncharacterized repeat protein (TIGR03806 family)